MINLLLDNIDEVVKNRIKIDFDTNFRIGIAFEIMMQNSKYSMQAKTYQALRLFYPEMNEIKDVKKAIDDIIWFYSCGRSEEKTSQKASGGYTKRIYSYEFDAEYIFSAFMEQYKIDLNKEHLHWWKFKSLFNSLNEEVLFSKIMSYRAIDLSKIKDKDMKKYYKKMKKIYALPDLRSEEEKENDFAEAFS